MNAIIHPLLNNEQQKNNQINQIYFINIKDRKLIWVLSKAILSKKVEFLSQSEIISHLALTKQQL